MRLEMDVNLDYKSAECDIIYSNSGHRHCRLTHTLRSDRCCNRNRNANAFSVWSTGKKKKAKDKLYNYRSTMEMVSRLLQLKKYHFP